MAHRVCELRVHDLAVLVVDREGSAWSGSSAVDTETDGTHGGHGEDVKPSALDPLTECRTVVEGGAILGCCMATARLFGASAGCGCSVCVHWASFATEETHSADCWRMCVCV